jgi:D-serine deaminase-like pyridoxal phosphate-dependent protein
VENIGEIPGPALLVYPDRIERNIQRMVAAAGGTENLRPHIKTHKMAEVVRLQMDAGINKFKCATIAEAEMIAGCGAADVLLAFPQVGPNAQRLARLASAFPQVRFSTIADDAGLVRALSAACSAAGVTVDVLLDIDNGMHRSGIEPGSAAMALYRLIADLPGIAPGGLHVYDGHVRDRDLATRAANAKAAFVPVEAMWRQLEADGLPVPRVVAGGTPSFPVHVERDDLETSPGTCVFWDINYGTKFPELDFAPAALVLARVISKPGANRLCIDLGYKSISPDNPYPRVELLDLPDVKLINHSEEHLAIETDRAGDFAVGDALYGVPYHICPTCALHREAVVVENGRAVARWKVVARDRKLTY